MEILCFDLDNTLVYAHRMHIEAFNMAFDKNKVKRPTRKDLLEHFSKVGIVMIKELFPNLSEKKALKILKDHDDYLIKETGKLVRVIPGAKTALKKLKPHYKIAILSNCKHKEIEAILKYANFDKDFFDLIIGNDDVKNGKPHPDELFKAKKLLHIKKGYMIGDSVYDVIAGKKAKLKTLAVLTGHHTEQMIKKERPTKIFNSVKEIPEYLLKKK